MAEWLTTLDVDLSRGLFAVGRGDGSVVIADLATGRPRRIEPLHPERLTALSFDGGILWTGGWEGQVVMWDLDRNEVRRKFDAGHRRVLSARPASIGLVTTGDDGNARIWNRDTGELVQTLEEKRFGAAYSVAVTPDWLVVGHHNGCVVVWKPVTKDGRTRWEYDGDFQPAGRGPCYSIAVSPARDVVAFGRDKRVSLYKPEGQWPQIERWDVPMACNDLQFNSTGGTIIGACSDRLVRLWDRKGGEGRWSLLDRRRGEGMTKEPWSSALICSGVRFVGDGKLLASFFDGTVKMYPSEGHAEQALQTAWHGVASPGGWGDAPPTPAQTMQSDIDGILGTIAASRTPAPPTAIVSIDGLHAYLDSRKVRHNVLPQGLTIQLHFGDRVDRSIGVRWPKEGREIRLSVAGEGTVPEPRRVEVERAVARLNGELGGPVWRTTPVLSAAVHVALKPDGTLAAEDFEQGLTSLRTTVNGSMGLMERIVAGRESAVAYARSSPECLLYMSLHPCACGQASPPPSKGVSSGGGGLVAGYGGPCLKCGRSRRFEFVLDPEMPPSDAYGASRPSRLFCPGQWALHSDRLASRWPADPAAIAPADRGRAREDLSWAVRALEEVIKFVPPGGDAVPAEAFASLEGRGAYAAEPGRFRKLRLEARLTAYRELLAKST